MLLEQSSHGSSEFNGQRVMFQVALDASLLITADLGSWQALQNAILLNCFSPTADRACRWVAVPILQLHSLHMRSYICVHRCSLLQSHQTPGLCGRHHSWRASQVLPTQQHANPSDHWIPQSTLGQSTTAWQILLKNACHKEEFSDWLAFLGICKYRWQTQDNGITQWHHNIPPFA